MAIAGSEPIAGAHTLAAPHAGVSLVAMASDDRTASGELAEEAGTRTTSLDEVAGEADALVVATAPSDRARLALRATGAGAIAIVEAPLATTLAEADVLVAAEESGARVRYGESLLFAPVVQAAAALTRRLGTLRFIEARSLSPRPVTAASTRGGGALFELGVHPIALVLLLACDEAPTAVRALVAVDPELGVDDHAEVELHFASGLIARVEASWRHPESVWDVQASSDTGVVRADLLPHIALEHDGEPVSLPPVPPEVEPHLVQFGYVAQLEALAGGADGPMSASVRGAAFGRDVLEVVCAAYSSAAVGGAPVALPFIGSRRSTPFELWRS